MTEAPRNRRDALTRVALQLLEDDGPEAVSTRKVAAAYGASTMAVYSEFGSLDGLVASVVAEGFGMLRDSLAAVPETADPVADLLRVAREYIAFARAHPHLYRVIYAVSPLAGHRREGEELMQGTEAFEVGHHHVRRAFRAGLMSLGSPYEAMVQAWLSWHGLVLADLAGYLDAMPLPEGSLEASMVRAMVLGFGGDPVATDASIASASSDRA